MKINIREKMQVITSVGIFLAFALLAFSFVSAVPTGPNGVTILSNSTLAAQSAWQLNVSGGYIATINISSTTQDPRWKAFVGNITGKFTLSDSSGATIYDWTLASVTGRVYATRNSSSVNWTNVQCANVSLLGIENNLMNLTSPYDNITRTFNGTTHAAFFVGSVQVSANTCPSTATYVNSAAQSTFFQEVALSDSSNFAAGGKIIYTTKLESQVNGYNNNPYDFQMIVPENGLPGFNGITPYYLYVELS